MSQNESIQDILVARLFYFYKNTHTTHRCILYTLYSNQEPKSARGEKNDSRSDKWTDELKKEIHIGK